MSRRCAALLTLHACSDTMTEPHGSTQLFERAACERKILVLISGPSGQPCVTHPRKSQPPPLKFGPLHPYDCTTPGPKKRLVALPRRPNATISAATPTKRYGAALTVARTHCSGAWCARTAKVSTLLASMDAMDASGVTERKDELRVSTALRAMKRRQATARWRRSGSCMD